jgi:hypothetical protein
LARARTQRTRIRRLRRRSWIKAGYQRATQRNGRSRRPGTAIGNQFEALGARNAVTVDDGLRSDVLDAVANYKRLGGSSPGVEAAANDLLSRNEPSIDGDVYNSLRSGLGKDAQTLRKSDPPQAQAYREIQGALEDAMERSIAANNPDDLGAFMEVRRQYGNFQDISKAASKLTGENAVAGTIPATRMQTVLSSGNKAPGYAAGQGDLAGLTRAGAAILGPQAQGGMSPFARQALAHALLGGAGAGYGGYRGGAEGALAGAAVGAGLPEGCGHGAALASGASLPHESGCARHRPEPKHFRAGRCPRGVFPNRHAAVIHGLQR